MGEDDGVVLGVGLVRPRRDPINVLGDIRTESPDVVAIHVQVRPPVHDPLGQLVPAAAAEHHPARVEAAIVEEAADTRIFAEKWLKKAASINASSYSIKFVVLFVYQTLPCDRE
jgi:hypothetical protein